MSLRRLTLPRAATGDYFLLPEDHQLEYLPLLAPWFIERHRERINEARRHAVKFPSLS